MDLTISEQLCYSTVRIECEYSDGTYGTGTGFFFEFLKDPVLHRSVPVVITNKHVINNAKIGRLIMTKADDNNNPIDTQHYQLTINNFEALWRKHPNENIDLCAMPLVPLLQQSRKDLQRLFFLKLDPSIIPNKDQLKELSAMEEIIMVGYPNGIWDNVNNKPILRKGITATHPNLDYCGKREFLIDAACFPGSSGSPVFILNENGYTDRRGTINIGNTRFYFLGVLYAGPQHTAEGEIRIIDVPISQKSIILSSIPNNLGIIIKSEKILELENLFK